MTLPIARHYNSGVHGIQLTVHVVIFSLFDDSLQVLLSPGQDSVWELPGAAVEADRSLEDAAARAFAGQIDCQHVYLEQLYTYGDPGRTAGQRHIRVVYFALVPSSLRRNSGNSLMCWFRIDSLPALAHDHAEITTYALRRLRYKLEYSAAGFQLLPDEFTLPELQQTYESVLGEKLDKRNFRRRILQAGIIEPTAHLRSGEGRPARLYRYRPDAVAEVKARRLFP